MIKDAVGDVPKIVFGDKVFFLLPEQRHDDEQSAGLEQVRNALHFLMRIEKMFEALGSKDKVMRASGQLGPEKRIIVCAGKPLAGYKSTKRRHVPTAVVKAGIAGVEQRKRRTYGMHQEAHVAGILNTVIMLLIAGLFELGLHVLSGWNEYHITTAAVVVVTLILTGYGRQVLRSLAKRAAKPLRKFIAASAGCRASLAGNRWYVIMLPAVRHH